MLKINHSTKNYKSYTKFKISTNITIRDKNHENLLSELRELTKQNSQLLFQVTIHLKIQINTDLTTSIQKSQIIYQIEDLEMIFHLGQESSKSIACGPRKPKTKLTGTIHTTTTTTIRTPINPHKNLHKSS